MSESKAEATDTFVYALMAVFGLSSWIAINGIYSELPLIINDLPEGWAINATLSLVIQAANIGPLAYFLVMRRRRTQQLTAG